ncbi:MAG TPA: ATP-binding protein [Actinomycetota bacterium]
MSTTEDRFVIEVPGEPEAVGTARLFATSVARVTGIDDETVEDVRLAVSEAVTERIRSTEGAFAPVCITAIVREKTVEFEITGGTASPSDGGRLGLAVIRSLFPDVAVDESPPAVRFAAPREPHEARADQDVNLGA